MTILKMAEKVTETEDKYIKSPMKFSNTVTAISQKNELKRSIRNAYLKGLGFESIFEKLTNY